MPSILHIVIATDLLWFSFRSDNSKILCIVSNDSAK